MAIGKNSVDQRARAAWKNIRQGGYEWWVHPQFARPEFLRRLESPSQLLKPPAKPVRQDGLPRLNQVFVTHLEAGPSLKIFIKRYRPKNSFSRLKEMFRESRARHSLEMTGQLAALGIATCLAVAAGERRGCCGWLADSFFLSTEVVGACNLAEFLKTSPPHSKTNSLWRQLGQIFARLHNSGLSHSDPSLYNFFVQKLPYDAKPRIVLIDLDAVRRPWKLTEEKARHDLRHFLKRIPLTRREAFWFIAEYAAHRRDSLSAHDWADGLALPGLARSGT